MTRPLKQQTRYNLFVTKTYKKESRMIWQKNSLNSQQTECDFSITYLRIDCALQGKAKKYIK